MKLPKQQSKKFEVLAAFRHRPMTVEQLISEVGTFGIDSGGVRRHVWGLVHDRYLNRSEDGVYSMTGATKAAFSDLESVYVAEVVPPRTFTFKPLDLSRLHNRDMRRKSTLDRQNTATFTVGLHANPNMKNA